MVYTCQQTPFSLEIHIETQLLIATHDATIRILRPAESTNIPVLSAVTYHSPAFFGTHATKARWTMVCVCDSYSILSHGRGHKCGKCL